MTSFIAVVGSGRSVSFSPASPAALSVATIAFNFSLPLDGAGGFGGHTVDHAVDAFHLVNDTGGGARQERVLEGIGIRRHAVGRSHGGDTPAIAKPRMRFGVDQLATPVPAKSRSVVQISASMSRASAST